MRAGSDTRLRASGRTMKSVPHCDTLGTTHGTATAVDARGHAAGLMVDALNGVSKADLLSPDYSPLPGGGYGAPPHPLIAEIARGSYRTKSPPDIEGTGYVVHSLEAALWAFATTENFHSGALAAVNLGDDADTTGRSSARSPGVLWAHVDSARVARAGHARGRDCRDGGAVAVPSFSSSITVRAPRRDG